MTDIAQLADIHFGAEDTAALAQVSRELAGDPPDLIVVCGDLTQRGKRREFAAARKWLAGLGRPVFCVPGNHDTPLLNLPARLTGAFDRFDRFFGEWSVARETGPWTVAGINTARGWQARRNWAEGVVNLDDLDAATRAGGNGPTMIICHHPFASLPDAPLRTSTIRGAAGEAIMQASPAHLLLTGHVHEPSAAVRRSPKGAYLAVAAGTLSTRLRGHPPSFNRIRTIDDQVTVTAHTCDGERVSQRSLLAPVSVNLL